MGGGGLSNSGTGRKFLADFADDASAKLYFVSLSYDIASVVKFVNSV